jgi:hypothetical protein
VLPFIPCPYPLFCHLRFVHPFVSYRDRAERGLCVPMVYIGAMDLLLLLPFIPRPQQPQNLSFDPSRAGWYTALNIQSLTGSRQIVKE